MKAKLQPRIEQADRPRLEDLIPLSTPLTIFVDPSSACNFACKFCPTGHRELIAETGRYQGVMHLDLFRKIVADLDEFDAPVKVLRLYKDGEPLLNKRFADMVRIAKASPKVDVVDTTTNAALATPARMGPILAAGIDRINVSVYGMTAETYRSFSGVACDPQRIADNVAWLYANRGTCEVAVKTTAELLANDEERARFFALFGDISDRIFVENLSPCWPEFDVETATGWTITQGLYGQPIDHGTDVCPYVFYSYSVNPDGLVSACFIDWGRKLVVGDVRTESMRAIWNGDAMNALRLQHLRGERKNNPVCGSCGQLSNCMPDKIDAHRETLLARVEASLTC